MGTEPFDPGIHKANQRKAWDSVAVGWEKWWPALERSMGVVTQRLMDIAQVQPGHRVLDVATGIGEPALTVARRIQPGGHVVATDQSSEMLKIARSRAKELGIDNVDFQEADAEGLKYSEGPFNIVLCRFGLMFLPDVPHTLQSIRQMLVPKGKFVTAIWEESPSSAPDEIAVEMAIEMFDLSPAPVGAPSFYDLANGVLERMMGEARFDEVRAEPVPVDFEWPSIESCQQFIRDVIPFFGVVANQPPNRQAEFWREHAAAVKPFMIPGGEIRSRSVAICVAGQT